jgi:hypothetical protein
MTLRDHLQGGAGKQGAGQEPMSTFQHKPPHLLVLRKHLSVIHDENLDRGFPSHRLFALGSVEVF